MDIQIVRRWDKIVITPLSKEGANWMLIHYETLTHQINADLIEDVIKDLKANFMGVDVL